VLNVVAVGWDSEGRGNISMGLKQEDEAFFIF